MSITLKVLSIALCSVLTLGSSNTSNADTCFPVVGVVPGAPNVGRLNNDISSLLIQSNPKAETPFPLFSYHCNDRYLRTEDPKIDYHIKAALEQIAQAGIDRIGRINPCLAAFVATSLRRTKLRVTCGSSAHPQAIAALERPGLLFWKEKVLHVGSFAWAVFLENNPPKTGTLAFSTPEGARRRTLAAEFNANVIFHELLHAVDGVDNHSITDHNNLSDLPEPVGKKQTTDDVVYSCAAMAFPEEGGAGKNSVSERLRHKDVTEDMRYAVANGNHQNRGQSAGGDTSHRRIPA